MPTQTETIIVENDMNEVCCDGGNNSLGHPVVWYSFNDTDKVKCLYCDRNFVKRTKTKPHKE